MLREPTDVRILQQWDLALQPRRQRLGRAVGGSGRNGWRMPAGIGLRARVVIREILDDYRPTLAFKQPQGRKDHSPLERRVVRGAERPPKLERNPQCPRRFGVLGLWPDQADRDRRDPLFLEIMPQRAHGARAERSNGREDDGVDVVALQTPGQFAGVWLHLD